eukprot:scaffold85133_cov63-Phaeocystis_antarctica.AAC.1
MEYFENNQVRPPCPPPRLQICVHVCAFCRAHRIRAVLAPRPNGFLVPMGAGGSRFLMAAVSVQAQRQMAARATRFCAGACGGRPRERPMRSPVRPRAQLWQPQSQLRLRRVGLDGL